MHPDLKYLFGAHNIYSIIGATTDWYNLDVNRGQSAGHNVHFEVTSAIGNVWRM